MSGVEFATSHATESHLYADATGKRLLIWGGTPKQQMDFLTQHAAEHPGVSIETADANGKWLVRYPVGKGGVLGLPEPVFRETFWSRLGLGAQKLMKAPNPTRAADAFKTIVQ